MCQDKNLEKIYEPSKVEDRLYKEWMDKGYFHAEVNKDKEPFTIVIPPPNVTGQLHMGHALNNTLQDVVIRMKRMQGFETLWLPGTDHASIATEAKVVEKIREEGKTKHDLGREGFLKESWEWTNKYGGRIVEQLKKLGCSCDWDRQRFTLDEGLSEAVSETFVRYYEKGLIYRGERIINWCPKCSTSISDIEIEYEERNGKLWHIAYPVKDSDEQLVIATTRPETILGDTAIAVHPDDERYTHLVGRTVILPLLDKEIPIITDTYVEKDFGTGAVKITPAHDPNDFMVGERHDLPLVKIMNDDATINELGVQYEGLDRYDARKQIIKDLDRVNLLIKIEEHNHNVNQCERCKTTVEPIISKQWFVKMEPLAKPAIDVVKDGKVKMIPERLEKIYYNWMENIQDWCISRQLWWGHKIPAYYCLDCEEIMVSKIAVTKCSKCSSTNLKEEEDTLDTWFSSALWPFSTLGWPEKTEELEYFFPTNVLITGADIIFFWVARMVFSSLELIGEAPFSQVMFTAIIKDEQGRKMSKSLGNGIDPLEIIEQYGTDALRAMLVAGNSPGNDMRFLIEKVEANRNFANKIWNAARFVLMNFEDGPDFTKVDKAKYTVEDKWIISRLNTVTKEVTANMEKFELGMAIQKISDFIWEEFCDWYIELVKPRLYDNENPTRLEAQYVLNYVLGNAMKLLHPYMPFITEEIYSHLIGTDESIMISKWPEYSEEDVHSSEESKITLVMEAIRSVRNIRSEMNVPVSRKAKLIFVTKGEAEIEILDYGKQFFGRLAGASDVVVQSDKAGVSDDAVSAVIPGAEIFVPLEELIDLDKEMERLEKEKENLEKELKRVSGKLNNESFISKAPQKVVNEEKGKQEKYQSMYDKVVERINTLKR